MRTETVIGWTAVLTALALCLGLSGLQSNGIKLSSAERDLVTWAITASFLISALIWVHLGWIEGLRRGWGEIMVGSLIIAVFFIALAGYHLFRVFVSPPPTVAPPVHISLGATATNTVEENRSTYGGVRSDFPPEQELPQGEKQGSASSAKTVAPMLSYDLSDLRDPDRGAKMADEIMAIRSAYSRAHQGAQPSDAWMNQKLENTGIAFRYRSTSGGFTLTPLGAK